jgi:hypothetical protein
MAATVNRCGRANQDMPDHCRGSPSSPLADQGSSDARPLTGPDQIAEETPRTITTARKAPFPQRLPLVVPLLALCTFLTIPTEYVVAGLLQQIADDLQVGLAQVGLLITAFAIGMIIGSPVMSLVTLRLPRPATLVIALLVFALGHVIAALSSSFGLILAARVLTALAAGAFSAVASVVATTAAGPGNSTRALGVMMSGVGLATVAGVPLGAYAGQLLGWRGSFWALAAWHHRNCRKRWCCWCCSSRSPRTRPAPSC